MAENDKPGDIPQEELEKDVTVTEVKEDALASLSPEQVAAIVKERDTLAAQKKHWRQKAIDPETGKPYRDLVAERRVEPPKPPQSHGTDVVEKRLSNLELTEEKRQFGYQHGLSPAAVDSVFAHAQGRNMKPEEALKDPFVKSGLAAVAAQERIDRGTPNVSRRSATVGGKSFLEMKPEDRRKNFGRITGASRE